MYVAPEHIQVPGVTLSDYDTVPSHSLEELIGNCRTPPQGEGGGGEM